MDKDPRGKDESLTVWWDETPGSQFFIVTGCKQHVIERYS